MVVAQWVVNLMMIYVVVGFLFAGVFVLFGVGKIDPAAKDSTAGFRFLILFGAAALWPLLLTRWLKRASYPPIEQNDHRNRARREIA